MKVFSMLMPMSLLWSAAALAQSPALVNNGATLFVSQGTVVKVNGNLENQAGSQLVNAGKIVLTGNLINNVPMTSAVAGALALEGTTPQSVSGQPLFVTDLTISNASGVTANAPVKVSNQVSFLQGLFTNSQAANALTFTSSASVSSSFLPSDASHVNGFVVKEGSGEFGFPIGDGVRYQPIGVNLTSNSLGMLARYEVGDAGQGPYTSSGSNPTVLVARNQSEYWNLSPLGVATGTVSVFWDDYNNEGIADISDLAVAHRVNDSWQNEGGVGAVGTTSKGSVTSNTLDSWSPFTLGSIVPRSPLPVRLVLFEGKLAEHSAQLSWTISDANQFSHFEVESSSDGRRFAKIGEVKFDGADTFTFTDPLLFRLRQTRYYRLKMVDLDGTSAFSKILSVQSDSGAADLAAFPNPAEGAIRFRVAQVPDTDVTVNVISQDGKVLDQQSVLISKGEGQLSVDNLPAGSYILSIRWNSGAEQLKFVKR